MSTQTSTPPRPHSGPDLAGVTSERRPAGRTIVASVAAGAIAALVLVLVVFAGGTEASITGGLLLGFGIGWALMVLLTVRRTRQPQRWAVIPAVAMGATGAALVILTPGDEALTALNWVWPPLMLTLAVWTFVQMRRSVTGKARLVLTAVTSVLTLAAFGATCENVARTGGSVEDSAPGVLHDVGGRRLHLDCRGDGSPTVVLFNGLGGVSAAWARISGPVSATTRVCAYDRAGQGWSDEAADPRDGLESAEDVHTLLATAGEPGPYVLVGHSTGGTYAMTYAARHPEQVAGLVLLDSSSPEQLTRMPAFPRQYALMRRGVALLPTINRLGVHRLLPATSHLPVTDAHRVASITSTSRAFRNQRDEISVLPDVFAQAQALTTLDDLPLGVLTASANHRGTRGWAGAQDQLAALSTNRIHRTVPSSHAGLLEDPRPAAQSVRAIHEVVTSARTGKPLDARYRE